MCLLFYYLYYSIDTELFSFNLCFSFKFQSTKGLMNYLKCVLLEIKHSWEADKIFSGGSKQNFVETILNLIENQNFDSLPNLILKSSILREYSTDKLINILGERLPRYFC